jgi:hypothetical protein
MVLNHRPPRGRYVQVRDDGREVVYSFVGYCDFCAHPTSVTQFSVSRENTHELSVVLNGVL